MSKFLRVPYGTTVHGQEEIDAVVEVLNTSTQMGHRTSRFEKLISRSFGKNYGVMVNSGSSALYLGVECLGLEEGTNVITPALTFSTTVGCLVKNGLIPNFVDVAPNTFCIDESKIEERVNENTSAIIAPDLMGNVCEWEAINKIAKKYNLKIIHDSADALGTKYLNKSPAVYSDFSITSFYGSHIINGAGNGGMIVTNDKKLADNCKLLRSWGRSSSLFSDSEAIENRFNISLSGINYDAKFVFERIGYQLEPSEISAAFGLVQLNKLEKNLLLRQKAFSEHTEFFKKYEEFFVLPKQNPKCTTGWLAYPIILKTNKFNRTDLQIYLEKRNIQTRVVFTGNILRQPGFKDIECIGNVDDYTNSDNVMKNGMLIACHHGLNEEMITHIHSSIDKFIGDL
jgi:CDP-6-deoxy-D-xylo-4-hexulose-3-dehydrase